MKIFEKAKQDRMTVAFLMHKNLSDAICMYFDVSNPNCPIINNLRRKGKRN